MNWGLQSDFLIANLLHQAMSLRCWKHRIRFGDEGLRKVIEMASDTTGIMGGWNDDGLFYRDAVYIIQDRELAVVLGKVNEQIAIFDLDNMQLILI